MSLTGPSSYNKESGEWVNPFYCLVSFAFKWLCSRPTRYLMRSLPAVFASIAIVTLLTVGQQRTDQSVEFYENLVQECFASNDLPAAQLYLEKVAQLVGHDQRRMFHLGLIVQQRGHLKQALQIMQRLAPDHETRYPAAHRWMAIRINSSSLNDARTKRLRHHLTAAVSARRNTLPEAQQLELRHRLAQLDIAHQRLDEASRQLRICFNSDSRFGIALARVYQMQGEPGLARSTIATAVKTFNRKMKEETANVEARKQLALLAVFDRDYLRAEKILVDGLQVPDLLDGDKAQLRVNIGLFSVQWADFLAKNKPDSWKRQLELLQRAMDSIPSHPALFNQFAKLTDADTATIRAVVDAMKRLLTRGQEPALAHWVLGTALVRLDDLPLAEKHLRLAIRENPKLGAGLNNLAWVLARRKPARLAEALQLVEIALKSIPNHPEVRETRGQIYLRLGEFKKAIIDLEFAIQGVRKKDVVHLALAQAYRKLGDTELAHSHQELARVTQTPRRTADRP